MKFKDELESRPAKAPSDIDGQTRHSEVRVSVCYMYMLLKTSHWDGFIFVSLQITVLFVCFVVVFFPSGHCVAPSSQSLYLSH